MCLGPVIARLELVGVSRLYCACLKFSLIPSQPSATLPLLPLPPPPPCLPSCLPVTTIRPVLSAAVNPLAPTPSNLPPRLCYINSTHISSQPCLRSCVSTSYFAILSVSFFNPFLRFSFLYLKQHLRIPLTLILSSLILERGEEEEEKEDR